jgi:hypothetical protein
MLGIGPTVRQRSGETAMHHKVWHPGPVTTKLAALLVAASLVVAMAAQAGASQASARASQAAPESVQADIHLQGGCYFIDGPGYVRVKGWMTVSSNEYGTGYVNIYKRTRSGNVLVARATRSGTSFRLTAYEPYQPYNYFATYGFNARTGSRSGGDDC